MRYRDLWLFCCECIETYAELPSNACVTPDAHVNDLAAHSFTLDVMSSEDLVFAREVTNGVIRHRHACEGALQGYCNALKRNKQDYTTMLLIGYLLMFRYEEVGGKPMRRLIERSTSNTRIAEYLGFLLDGSMLRQHAAPVWQTHYDDGFVENALIGNLERIAPSAKADVLQWYLQKATNLTATISDEDHEQEGDLMNDSAEHKGTLTSTAAFLGGTSGTMATTHKGRTMTSTATASRPAPTKASSPKFTQRRESKRDAELKMIPPLEVREMAYTVAPPRPPKVVHEATEHERAAVAAANTGNKFASTLDPEVKKQNRRREAEIPFAEFKSNDRPTDMSRLLAEKSQREEEEIRQLKLDRPGPDEVRERLQKISKEADVRVTNATLRREEILYRRRAEAEAQALLRREQEMRDDSEFVAWKAREDAKEKAQEDAKIAQRKVEMMLADEDARAVRRKQMEANHAISRQFKKELDEWRVDFQSEVRHEQKRQRDQAAKLRTDLAEKTQEAVTAVVRSKKEIAHSMKKVKQKNEMKVAMAMELERDRKVAMIAEIKRIHAESVHIRTIERAKKRHVRAVDIGQLVAMTVDELRDKLVEVKDERAALVEKKRKEIVAAREQEKRDQEDLMAKIMAERQAFRDAKERKRGANRDEQVVHKEQQRLVEEQRLIDTQARLQAKREERKLEVEGRREEERERRLAAQLVAKDAGAVEVEKWREMELGAQNVIIRAQNHRMANNRVERAKRAALEKQRDLNLASERHAHESRRIETETLFETKRDTYQKDKQRDDSVRIQAFSDMKKEREMMRTRTA